MKYVAQLLSLSALFMVYQDTFSSERKTKTARSRKDVIQHLQPTIQHEIEETTNLLDVWRLGWAVAQTCFYYQEQAAKQQQHQTPPAPPIASTAAPRTSPCTKISNTLSAVFRIIKRS